MDKHERIALLGKSREEVLQLIGQLYELLREPTQNTAMLSKDMEKSLDLVRRIDEKLERLRDEAPDKKTK